MLKWCKKNQKWILWILTLGWMLLIFMFSAQNGTESAELSGGITERIVRTFVRDFEQLSAARQERIMNNVSFAVRKLAHYTEYLVLGVLLFSLVRAYRCSERTAFFISWGAGTLYAVSDEIHQMFSDGRSPQVRDVCIDSAGVLTGALLVWALFVFWRRTIDKRQKKRLS